MESLGKVNRTDGNSTRKVKGNSYKIYILPSFSGTELDEPISLTWKTAGEKSIPACKANCKLSPSPVL